MVEQMALMAEGLSALGKAVADGVNAGVINQSPAFLELSAALTDNERALVDLSALTGREPAELIRLTGMAYPTINDLRTIPLGSVAQDVFTADVAEFGRRVYYLRMGYLLLGEFDEEAQPIR